MFCRSLFVLLYFFFWPLCCLFFFDKQILITSWVSSHSSYNTLKPTTWCAWSYVISCRSFANIMLYFRVIIWLCYHDSLKKCAIYVYVLDHTVAWNIETMSLRKWNWIWISWDINLSDERTHMIERTSISLFPAFQYHGVLHK